MAQGPRQPSRTPAPPPAQGFQIPIRTPAEYLEVILQRWWLGAILGVLLAIPLGYRQIAVPLVFNSSGRLLYERPQNILDVRQVVEDPAFQLELQRLRSGPFRDAVAARFAEDEVALLQSGYTDAPGMPPPGVRSLVNGVQVSQVGGFPILEVFASGRSGDEVRLLVSAFMDEVIRQATERTELGTGAALTFLRNEARELEGRIADAERRLLEVRQRPDMAALEDSQGLLNARLSTITSAITSARLRRVELEAAVQELDATLAAGSSPLGLAVVAQREPVAAARARIVELEREAETLAQRYLERHPRVVENTFRLEVARRQLDEAVARAVLEARDELARASQAEERLRAEYAAAEREILEMEKTGVELIALRRQLENDKRTYDSVLERLNEAVLASRIGSGTFTIQEAPGWWMASGPSRMRAAGFALAVLLACVVAVPVVIDMLDRRLKSSRDVELQIGTELLGEIQEFAAFEKGAQGFLGADTADDAFNDSFRAIHSQITLLSKVPFPKIIAVTSTVPAEGKSFVTSNLACVFAAHHLRTLVVDVDFRRPTQHRIARLENNAGLVAWMQGDSQPEDAFDDPRLGIARILPGLDLLRSGGTSKRPTELMTDARFRRLLEVARQRYDVVLVDTPPAGLFSDAMMAGQFCDELVYVARFGAGSIGQVREIVARLRGGNARLLGIIMNRMPVRLGARYYYRGYTYGSDRYRRYYTERG